MYFVEKFKNLSIQITILKIISVSKNFPFEKSIKDKNHYIYVQQKYQLITI